MGPIKQIEDKLGEVYKSAPAMPENAKKTLVDFWPWLALFFGVVQIWGAYALYNLGHTTNNAINYINSISKAYGGKTVSAELGFTYWLSLIVIVTSGVLLLLAYPGLKAKKKAGWDWLFIGALANLLYGVVRVFSSYGGISYLFSAAIGSAITFYLLYQVRSHYKN